MPDGGHGHGHGSISKKALGLQTASFLRLRAALFFEIGPDVPAPSGRAFVEIGPKCLPSISKFHVKSGPKVPSGFLKADFYYSQTYCNP